MPAQPLISLCLPNPIYNNDRIAKTVYRQTLNILSQKPPVIPAKPQSLPALRL